MNFNPIPLLKNKNTNVPIQKDIRWYEWFAAKETSFKNASIAYLNYRLNNSSLDAEEKACGIITISIIESTFENDHIHVLHDLQKQYIYGY